MTQWETMESAPREIGSPLLLFPRPGAPVGPTSTAFEGYWDGESWRTAGGIICYPTAWMPMPGPPLVIVRSRE